MIFCLSCLCLNFSLRLIKHYISKMRIINTWGNPNKQSDKYQAKLRLGRLTVFDFYKDTGDRKWALTLFNFTFKP